MQVVELLHSQCLLYREERDRIFGPLKENINKEFVAKAGPLLRTAGIPPVARLKKKYPTNRDVILLELIEDNRFTDWIESAITLPFENEQVMLQFALTVPFGLRFIVESLSDIGFMEVLRRSRRAIGASRVPVGPWKIDYDIINLEGNIRLHLTPPEEEWGTAAIRAYFISYLRHRPRGFEEGVIEWMKQEPVERMEPLLPKWDGGLPVAIPAKRAPLMVRQRWEEAARQRLEARWMDNLRRKARLRQLHHKMRIQLEIHLLVSHLRQQSDQEDGTRHEPEPVDTSESSQPQASGFISHHYLDDYLLTF